MLRGFETLPFDRDGVPARLEERNNIKALAIRFGFDGDAGGLIGDPHDGIGNNGSARIGDGSFDRS
jgi:hypothetical protein